MQKKCSCFCIIPMVSVIPGVAVASTSLLSYLQNVTVEQILVPPGLQLYVQCLQALLNWTI